MTEHIINKTETEERECLRHVRSKIEAVLSNLGDTVKAQFNDTMSLKRHLQDNRADMDHIEKAGLRQSIDHMSIIGDKKVAHAWRMSRLRQNPYFGRLDFKDNQSYERRAVYIGLHSFHDELEGKHLVHDWRAPISSMFYDFELGEAFFDAPAGRVSGDIALKRQYRIKNGEMLFMLETALNINDEILQKELSHASDDKMRNIVATIQRDQNAIIRNDRTHTLIIQGAAGSGKTSIALHRIAFLLYKFKDDIKADDILIVSPNKVFAHYISQVLPELGEEMIRETTMESLADELLAYKINFQTFFEQVSRLLDGHDKAFAQRIAFKSTSGFLRKIEDYAVHVKNSNVTPAEMYINGKIIPADWFKHQLTRGIDKSYAKKINDVTDALVFKMKSEHKLEIAGDERALIREDIKKMLVCTNIRTLYKQFYVWLEKPGMFKQAKGSVYEFADVFPLIYLSMLLEGFQPRAHVKHLVVDEMQDYTPVQYRVLSMLFNCRRTILGDRNQSVNPLSSSTAENIRDIFSDAECMYMHKSYRSTLQITRFAQRINRNEDLIPIERHGPEPDIIDCAYDGEELAHIRHHVACFFKSDAHALGIICKTQTQADRLHTLIKDLHHDIHLLNAASTVFSGGVIVATAHLAKGLEFDEVLVPFCTAANYNSLIDRHMLYVACTRAMHRLVLTHTDRVTPFIEPASA